jgi:WXG100 family type VII secretion target
MASDGVYYQVDLDALSDAISGVSGQRDSIQSEIQALKSTFSSIENDWVSPAGTTFSALTAHFNSVTDQFTSLLDDAIGRMNAVHATYSGTEATNTQNLH